MLRAALIALGAVVAALVAYAGAYWFAVRDQWALRDAYGTRSSLLWFDRSIPRDRFVHAFFLPAIALDHRLGGRSCMLN